MEHLTLTRPNKHMNNSLDSCCTSGWKPHGAVSHWRLHTGYPKTNPKQNYIEKKSAFLLISIVPRLRGPRCCQAGGWFPFIRGCSEQRWPVYSWYLTILLLSYTCFLGINVLFLLLLLFYWENVIYWMNLNAHTFIKARTVSFAQVVFKCWLKTKFTRRSILASFFFFTHSHQLWRKAEFHPPFQHISIRSWGERPRGGAM